MRLLRDFNSAGHWNHSFWWRQLAPAGSKEASYEKSASPELKQAIADRFGFLDNLKQVNGFGHLSKSAFSCKLWNVKVKGAQSVPVSTGHSIGLVRDRHPSLRALNLCCTVQQAMLLQDL